jgi:hypothetical protein
VPRAVLANAEVSVTLGVDTHKDVHVSVALDGLGRHLGTLSYSGAYRDSRTVSEGGFSGVFWRDAESSEACYRS